MKPTAFHASSALVGVVAGALLLLCMSQISPTLTATQIGLEIKGIPTPQQMLRIVEVAPPQGPNASVQPGSSVQGFAVEPYMVPPGKLFVVTGSGSQGGAALVNVIVDGAVVLSHAALTGDGGAPLGSAGAEVNGDTGSVNAVRAVPPGLVIRGGQVIAVNTFGLGGGIGVEGQVLGYLVDV